MKSLALALLCTLGFTTAHAAGETQGLPADAAGAVFVSNEVIDRTVFGQALSAAFKKDVTQNATTQALEAKLGIRIDEDIKEITAGLYPPAAANPEEPIVVVLIRGTFNPVRIEDYARTQKVPSTTFGKYKAWDITRLMEVVTGTPNQAVNQDGVLLAYSQDLLVLCSKTKVAETLAALAGQAPSWKLNSILQKQKGALSNNGVYVYVDLLKVAAESEKADIREKGLQEITFSLGEANLNLQGQLTLLFTDESKATGAAIEAKTLLAALDAASVLGMLGKKPEEAANLKKVTDLLQKIELTTDGRVLTAKLSYPAEAAVTALIEAIKKAQLEPGK